jgi:hypothetical protein
MAEFLPILYWHSASGTFQVETESDYLTDWFYSDPPYIKRTVKNWPVKRLNKINYRQIQNADKQQNHHF